MVRGNKMKKRIQIVVIKYNSVSVEANVSLVDKTRSQIGSMATINTFKKLDGEYAINDHELRDLRAVKSDGLTEEQIEGVKGKIAKMADSMEIGKKKVDTITI